MMRRVALWLGGVAFAASPAGSRAEPPREARLHFEAGLLAGAHTIGDEESAGATEAMFGIRVLNAIGGIAPVGDGGIEMGGHLVLTATTADRGGGIALGADYLVRWQLAPELALDTRAALLKAVAGDDGNPPYVLAPGVGLTFGADGSFSLRVDGELTRKDLGDGHGVGLFGGIAGSGRAAAITTVVVAAIGAAVFLIAVDQAF
jgi:hypothetical protein